MIKRGINSQFLSLYSDETEQEEEEDDENNEFRPIKHIAKKRKKFVYLYVFDQASRRTGTRWNKRKEKISRVSSLTREFKWAINIYTISTGENQSH